MSMLQKDSTIMSGQEEIRTAHLDSAHVGDIQGAWGTIRRGDTAIRKTWITRLLTLLIIMGPGLITMVGDNDAGGIATYIGAGQNYGTSLLWTLLILIPVLIVNQEMVVRLGAISGVGHARLIFERFGKFWGAFSVIDLFVLNFLTIVTEFIGFSLGLQFFGVSPYLSVPIGVVGLIAVTVTGSFRRWESVMWLCCIVILQRSESFLWQLCRAHRVCWRDRVDPQCTAWAAHHRGASSGRYSTAECHRLPGAAVQ